MDAADFIALAVLILAGCVGLLGLLWLLGAVVIWIDALWQHFLFWRMRKEYIQKHGVELIDYYNTMLASHRVMCFGSALERTNPLKMLKLVVEAIRAIGRWLGAGQ